MSTEKQFVDPYRTAYQALMRGRKAAKEDVERASGSCEWTENDSGQWITHCGGSFEVTTGTPEDNHMKFCCFCGKMITFIKYKPEDDEE